MTKKTKKTPKNINEQKNLGGRPTKFTDIVKAEILHGLEEGLPREVCARLVGVHPETLRQYLTRDEGFLVQIEMAEAVGIRGLAALTKEQNGAWKLLKNIGKMYYKEHIEMSFDESKPITIRGKDGNEEII